MKWSFHVLKDLVVGKIRWQRKNNSKGKKIFLIPLWHVIMSSFFLSLSAFIAKHLPAHLLTHVPLDSCSNDANVRHSISTFPEASVVSVSMLGQPPDSDAPSAASTTSGGETLSRGIVDFLKDQGVNKNTGSYHDFIMNERLDDKETMFMDGKN